MKRELKLRIINGLGLMLFVVACGIKGPPLPPIDEETIQKQKAADLQSADASKARAASEDSSKAKATKKK